MFNELSSKMVSISQGPVNNGLQACSSSLYMAFWQMKGM